jgi:hypothetical protein
MRKHIIAVLLVLLLLPACSAATELTRSQSKVLLSKSDLCTTRYNPLRWVDNGYQMFIALGGTRNADFAKALSFADEASARFYAARTLSVDEITGITDAGNGQASKLVLFRWSEDVPEVLRPLLAFRGTGKAIMRLYDDGWRVENFSLAEDRTSPPLTASQRKQFETYRETERNRQRLVAAEAERSAAEVAESKKPTQEILVTTTVHGGARSDRNTDTPAKITDVGLTFKDWVLDSTITFWYGNIAKFTLAPGNSTYWPSVIIWPFEGSGLSIFFRTEADQQRFSATLTAAYSAWWKKYGSAVRSTGK